MLCHCEEVTLPLTVGSKTVKEKGTQIQTKKRKVIKIATITAIILLLGTGVYVLGTITDFKFTYSAYEQRKLIIQLRDAVRYGTPEEVINLVEQGADINNTNNEGKTTMEVILKSGSYNKYVVDNPEVIDYLTEQGAY